MSPKVIVWIAENLSPYRGYVEFTCLTCVTLKQSVQPYAFHQVMRSMLLPLRLATNARNLELVTDLDMEIDKVLVFFLNLRYDSVINPQQIARRAAYEALGEDHETIEKHMKEQPSGESYYGIVVGDETRLRQVVTNLARWV